MSSCSILASSPLARTFRSLACASSFLASSSLVRGLLAFCSLNPTSRFHSAFCCSSLADLLVHARRSRRLRGRSPRSDGTPMQPRRRKISRPWLSVSAISVTTSLAWHCWQPASIFSLWCSGHNQNLLYPCAFSTLAERRAVASMARRAAELFRIVDLQQFFVRMAGEYRLAAHRRLGDGHRLARSQVARFAAVHQVHILHVNLPYADIELIERVLHRRDGRRAGLRDPVRKVLDRAWRAVPSPASSMSTRCCSSFAFSSFHA